MLACLSACDVESMYIRNNRSYALLIAAVFAVVCFAAGRVAVCGEDFDEFDKLRAFESEFSSPFEDVTPDHWAYKAVMHLAEIGLLEGGEGKNFLGDQVVTRYELAVLISRMLDNYIKLQDSGGTLTIRRQVELPRTETAAQPPTTHPGEVTIRRISPNERIIVPGAGGKTLFRSGPATLTGTAPIAPVTPVLVEPPALMGIEEIEKKIDLTQKDVETLEKLVNSFKKELKDVSKEFKKELGEIKKISLKNEKQINSLKEENERFSVTGENEFIYYSWGATHGREFGELDQLDEATDECPATYPNCLTDFFNNSSRVVMREVQLVDILTIDLHSKPKPNENLTLDAKIRSINHLSGSGGFLYYQDGMTDRSLYAYKKRSRSSLELQEISLFYDNSAEKAGKPKNFKLREIRLGEFSTTYSPLTTLGTLLTGAHFQFTLNKYSLNMFAAREMRHPSSMFFSQLYRDGNGDLLDPKDTRFFDRYFYGANVQFPLFGEERAMSGVTKVFLFDDEDTTYPGCLGHTGSWVDINPDIDTRSMKEASSDILNKDIFCLPPEKNSVTSFFTRYPIFKNVILTGEYAHSTYYKTEYFAMKPDQEACDWLGTSGSINCYKIPENDDHDDAFLLMLEYSKPPLRIFPLGYIRLGPRFVSDHLGMPGMDMSSFSLSFLPINLQSLEVFMAGAGIDQISKKNYAYDTMYIKIKETRPMQFDVGELLASFATSDTKATISDVLPKPISFFNRRGTKLGINVWMNNFKYNISEKISMKAGFTDVSVSLPESCLDNDLVLIKDDNGTAVDIQYGDGVTQCESQGGTDTVENFGIKMKYRKHKYTLDWKTSKNTDLTSTFTINETDLAFTYNPTVESVIKDLAPRGKYYHMGSVLTHRLTTSTSIKIGYFMAFDTYPDSDDSGKYPVQDQDHFLFYADTKF